MRDHPRLRFCDPLKGAVQECNGQASYTWCEKSLLRVSDQGCGLQEHRLQTAEQAEAFYKKNEKRPAPAGWEAFNQKTLFEAYERRVDGMEVDLEVCSADAPLLPTPVLLCQLDHRRRADWRESF